MPPRLITEPGHPARRAQRVLLLTDSLANGGAERQLTLVATSLPGSWLPEVWAFDHGPFEDILLDAGVKVTVTKRRWSYDPVPAASLWRALNEDHVDVVHSWGWMPTAVAGPLCRGRRIPLIDGSIRSEVVAPERGPAQRLAMRWAGLILANSRAGLEAYGVPGSQGRVIYNGFDMTRLSGVGQIPPASRWADTSPVRVVMTGRMVDEKDYPAFVSVARNLASHRAQSRFEFIAVGSGPTRGAIVESAGDLISRGVMRCLEPGTEVLPIVNSAHIGVLLTKPPLYAEGCSNSILEYMACGLPVVCSRGGGNGELVEEGITGFLTPPGDAAAVSDRLLWLATNREAAVAMGEAGRRKLVQRFSTERMIGQTVAAYEAVARRGSVGLQ